MSKHSNIHKVETSVCFSYKKITITHRFWIPKAIPASKM